MTNKQFYTLGGIIFLCTASITQAWYTYLLAFVYFIASIRTND
jgi:hypothetical protein